MVEMFPYQCDFISSDGNTVTSPTGFMNPYSGRTIVSYDLYKQWHPDTLITKEQYYWNNMHLV